MSRRIGPTRTGSGADRARHGVRDAGRRRPDAVRGAAARGDGRRQHRFTRQDGVEETWRIMQPLLDAPPPVQPYAPGSWGPECGGSARRRPRPLARAVDRLMTPTSDDQQTAAERGGAVAVPADRGLRVPLRLPHRRARRARRRGRLALRPELRLAERVREPARPRGRLLPVRPVRDRPSDGARLRAGHERARDDLEDAVGLDRRPRCPDDGPDATTRTRSRPTRGRRPTTTPTTCWSGPSSASTDGSRSSWSASRRSTTAAHRPSGRWSTADARRRRDRRRPDVRLATEPRARRSRATACGRGTCWKPGDRAFCALSWAEELAAPQTSTTRRARIAATTRFWRALAQRGAHPGPPLARSDPALRARRSRA